MECWNHGNNPGYGIGFFQFFERRDPRHFLATFQRYLEITIVLKDCVISMFAGNTFTPAATETFSAAPAVRGGAEYRPGQSIGAGWTS